MKLLLEAGTNTEKEDIVGHTALHFAARAGEQAAVEMLLEAAADPLKVTRGGKSALDFATENGHVETALLLQVACKDRSENDTRLRMMSEVETWQLVDWSWCVYSLPGKNHDDAEACLLMKKRVQYFAMLMELICFVSVLLMLWLGREVVRGSCCSNTVVVVLVVEEAVVV